MQRIKKCVYPKQQQQKKKWNQKRKREYDVTFRTMDEIQ